MKSATSHLIAWTSLVWLIGCDSGDSGSRETRTSVPTSPASTDTLRQNVLREAAIRNGFAEASSLEIPGDPRRQEIGERLFASELLSLNSNMSCQTCHLDEFSSADGLPNAIGVDGEGSGVERMERGGVIVPRNTLPLWGRGGAGFDTFFWDGKVERTDDGIVSQFGYDLPSDDPLTVAVHLPFVEIREMVVDDDEVRDELMTEDVSSADRIYQRLVDRIRDDQELGAALAAAYDVPRQELEFLHIADAVAQFIRHNFRVQPTRLHRFVFEDGQISDAELRGGIIFYGKGRCASCHNGPYFSDFGFHAVAFPQAGFGRNGFGIDYGRYNVTFDPDDRYMFRTPPLFNVTRTAPYSHSGSVNELAQAITYHFDPLRFTDESTDAVERVEQFRRLGVAASEDLPAYLTDDEVQDLVAFLAMLEF